MEDFYGKKFWKIEKKIFAIFLKIFFSKFLCSKNFRIQIFFCRKFFPAWAAVGGQKGGEAPSKASEASLAPQASHQPPKAASVRVNLKMPNWPNLQQKHDIPTFTNAHT